jgi:sarcosine oxidase subunit alpha
VTQPFRNADGGAIDRARPLAFTFNDQAYQGYAGDTLASALLANGVRLVARSFKYHRPRGIVSAGPEEPAALVEVGAGARVLPNGPATMVELYDGLEARSVNCCPSVEFDLGNIGDALSAWMPAGFYYKTFMWPGRAWMLYERFIRRAAGIGVTPGATDPDRYEKRHAHCDVLVIGGGPAGLAAAFAAGAAGARVLLVEERAALGGQLLFRRETMDDMSSEQWLPARLAELDGMPEVTILTRATATGYYDHDLVTVLERVTDHLAQPPQHLPRQRLWKVRAKRVIVASGAIERPYAFATNDLPGVMLASAAQRYAAQYAVRPGARAVLVTNNDSGYEAALALADKGVEIGAVFDPRLTPTAAAAAARSRGIAILPGHAVMAAHGRRRVESVSVAPIDTRSLLPAGPTRRFACDLVCVAGGWDPALHLYSQAGGKVEFDIEQRCFVPGAAAQSVRAAGAANGAFGVDDCIAQGRAAGMAAAGGDGLVAGAGSLLQLRPLAVMPLWEAPCDDRGAKKFVDLQSDVTAADIALAAREGYVAVEHAKRYTTTGMGIDQGKTGNVIAYGILAGITGKSIPEIGTTTFRPPYTPVTLGAFAGREIGERLDPWRRTPITGRHVEAGAVFEPVGLWRRPLYYPRAGEDMNAAISRECRAVRERVGLLDASTLGKLEICGPDAARFLNRVYTNAWDSLRVGQCRYGLMLHEDGMVFDDGVTARLGEHEYLMTTTSGGAEHVYNWLEDWLQCEWRELKVFVTPVTAQWATLCVTGPRAREVIAKLAGDIDVSPAGFPHMALREGRNMGVKARVARVSYTGELSFEINVPARYGAALWEALLAAGAEFDIAPLGTEALHVRRAEKGYIVVGHDTDGTVTPIDLGMDWVVSRTKGDFLGKRGLVRGDNMRVGRKQFVGLLTDEPGVVVPEGSQVVVESDAVKIAHPPVPMLGHVTSSYRSAALGRSIALALIADGRRRIGDTVAIVARGRTVTARVTEPCFYDNEGARLRG